jgi:putative transcriptional regulator
VQAVSENLKTLVDEGWVETGSGQSRYKITKRGIEKVKTEANNLRKYADQVIDTMNTYKSVWPAIAQEDMNEGESVWLKMEDGTLYAVKEETPAQAEVLHDALKGEDVALISLSGTIELEPGFVVIMKLPTINQGGTRACDLDNVQKILEKYEARVQKVGVMGTFPGHWQINWA